MLSESYLSAGWAETEGRVGNKMREIKSATAKWDSFNTGLLERNCCELRSESRCQRDRGLTGMGTFPLR